MECVGVLLKTFTFSYTREDCMTEFRMPRVWQACCTILHWYWDLLRAGRSGDRQTRPDRPWGPSSLLYNGYRVIPGGKAAGAWRWPPTPPSAEVKERVELYLYSPSGPSWPVLGWTFPLPLLKALHTTQASRTEGTHVCKPQSHSTGCSYRDIQNGARIQQLLKNEFRAYVILPCKMVNVLSAERKVVSEGAVEPRIITVT
jgi:hypothetical protein